ncbi:hypothetical protein Pa4123_52130 [Phytohabitans aurantiacus]|uniref:Recombinase domain-containing protein n=1 Tax=Phytohabitans aurantiacus TaxID=3016789 RepID=A0ABQ5R0W4_9ACTN|nr:recombinase family protein [Phytohabitans aurantiacus]GLH99937.1 hypothetical protein Pa4123_52130 [Phytohabitans aurantiacus]
MDPDPTTAPHVQWIFDQRVAGASTASIARTLNQRGIPSPAAHDPTRNPHRHQPVWTVRTIAAILASPRYTGRQVWNRQRTDHHETVPGDKRTSLGKTRAWNPKSEWVVSAKPAHPALVSDADFRTAQHVRATAAPHDDQPRVYALTGLLICQTCGRRLQPHWVHGHPGYRCRHGRTSAHPPNNHPRWVYWPERRLLTETLAALTDTDPLPGLTGVADLAGYLRARDAVIICATTTLTIDDPTEPASTAIAAQTTPDTLPATATQPSNTQRGPNHRQERPSTAQDAPNERHRTAVIGRQKQRTPPPPSRNVNSFGGV